MTQHDQDRDRIAEAMNKVQTKSGWTEKEFESLDQAVYAFETLCEPKGFDLELRRTSLGPRYWIASRLGSPIAPSVESTRNHADDVCRLVCEVLDREQEAGR